MKASDDTMKKNKIKNALYGEAVNVGLYLATPLLLGVFAGIGLDRWLNTKPLFIISGLVVGSVGTFYNLFKLVKEDAGH